MFFNLGQLFLSIVGAIVIVLVAVETKYFVLAKSLLK